MGDGEKRKAPESKKLKNFCVLGYKRTSEWAKRTCRNDYIEYTWTSCWYWRRRFYSWCKKNCKYRALNQALLYGQNRSQIIKLPKGGSAAISNLFNPKHVQLSQNVWVQIYAIKFCKKQTGRAKYRIYLKIWKETLYHFLNVISTLFLSYWLRLVFAEWIWSIWKKSFDITIKLNLELIQWIKWDYNLKR